jgi:hypothetical protein
MSLFNFIHRKFYSSKFRFCLILCAIFTSSLVFSQNSKVTICHQGTTQEINSNALSAHFEEDGSTKPGHEGDSLGPCEVSNTSPIADAKTATTSEEGSVTIILSGSDQDGDSLSYSITQPSNGSAVLGEDGVTVTYTPVANFNGTDSFTYMANDGTANSAPATVTVSVSAVNDAPVADAKTATTSEEGSVTITLSGSDQDGDSLSYSITQPSNGSAVLGEDGVTVTYTPVANFNGTDSFTYMANDGTANSAPATVTVSVSAVNDAPVADAKTATTSEEGSVTITLSGSDQDGDSLSYSITQPSNGSAVLGEDGVTVTYTPVANFNGTDSFTYMANDGTANSAPATVTVSVSAVNDAPVADAKTATTSEEGSVTITLSGSDQDGDSLSYSITQPSNGSAVLGEDGVTVTYTPVANFNGTDSFTYMANDGTANSAPATVTVSVSAVNDAPVADAKTATTSEEGSVTITLSGSDQDGDSLSYSITQPSNGSAVLGEDGVTVTYTPVANFNGTDSFTYMANDGTANSAPATVTVSVSAVNDAPVADAKTATTSEEGSVTITLSGSDQDGDSLSYSITQPSNGSAVLGEDGVTVTYTPVANFNGTDSFTYMANDGTANSAPATVTVSVSAVNDAPVADAKTATTSEEGSVTITLSGSDQDGDSLSYSITQPSNGSAVLGEDGVTVTYTPVANFNGTDSFTYMANDGTANSAPATVTVSVSAVNDAPVADAKTATTSEEGSVTITLSGSDQDGDSLSYSITQPSNGSAVLGEDGVTVTYTPVANFNGTDSFTYMANDGTANSAPATVTVSVSAVNDAPVADAKTATTSEEGSVTITLSGSDQDGDSLSYSITQPSNGSAVLGEDGVTVTYTPVANFNGTDSFTYMANDGTANSAPATVTVSVSAVNDAPVADAKTATTSEEGSVTITLSGSDQDGDSLSYSITQPSNGSAVLGEDGVTVTYTPVANFNGTDSFTYMANDGTANSAPATVTVSVSAVNDAPVADAKTATTSEEGSVTITLSGSDQDGDSLSYSITQPSNGSAVLGEDGVTVTYTPVANFNGTDSFTYMANDGTANSAPATVTVSVSAVNDACSGC